ncbi:DUF6090 family protein [Fulvivirga sedimenti]|uniref:Uncharacterized protein n=1 Tax=Fulvivirga sedimenti TaxID=2879465 RepID=A0A9X1HRJ1_9BACT|nr:DUF6090 family protein [Fulvivirga sedimenti]MCA6075059.1 hypothetical protein [Fulvivirga sedimenti]MCA6076236.1 hypothetical protein [Fulvivirga sedimenti]MCA6077364.1 hypothetical protein [Fulvivirga sedimenti]
MIKFFRTIRLKLINRNSPSSASGRFSRYLIYAIGEIILVVIGILIALQINTWNEQKKQRAEEISTLRNIRTDFINAIIEFEENNAFREEIISKTSSLYTLIRDEQINYTKQRIDSLIAGLLINPTYNGQSETLNILFNSGKINIISNDSIKNALVLWPQQVADITEDEVYSSNALYNMVLPVVRQYVALYDVYRSIDYRGYALFQSQSPSPFESDYAGLLKDPDFESSLTTRELTISVSLLQSRELIETAQEIINMIDAEINKSE